MPAVKMDTIKAKLSGFSLVETLCAVTLLSIATTAFFMTISWLLQVDRSALQLRSTAILRNLSEEIAAEGGIILNNQTELPGYYIKKELRPVQNYSGIFHLRLEIFDKNDRSAGYYETFLKFP